MAIREYQGTKNRPGLKGYVTREFSGKDVRKARGLLDKQAKESAAKINEEKCREWTHPVRNHLGQVKYMNERSLQQILVMETANKKLYPKGPPATRPTISMGAYIQDGKVIRDNEED